jgi:hypothetical protein
LQRFHVDHIREINSHVSSNVCIVVSRALKAELEHYGKGIHLGTGKMVLGTVRNVDIRSGYG